MKDIKKILFIIQARTQSTRISRKMIREFDGNDSLMDIAIKKIKSSDVIPSENFWLSILDNELIDIAKKHDVKYYWRSEESTQEPITLPKVFEWHSYFMAKGYEYYVNINACNPILTIDTIDDFTRKFVESDSNGMFAVKEIKNFVYDVDGKLMNKFNGEHDYLVTLETKLVDSVYMGAHNLYAGKLDDIHNNIYMGSFEKKGDPEFYIMKESECWDIDYPYQWRVAQLLYKNNFIVKE